MIKTKFISPLEKVFREKEPQLTQFERRAYAGEQYCFQFCITTTVSGTLYLDIHSSIADKIKVYEVKYVPASMADYINPDDYRIFTERTSGYYPDLLEPAPKALRVVDGYWLTLFITVDGALPTGEYSIRFVTGDYYVRDVLSDDTFIFSVSDCALQSCDIPVSLWNYYDCIALAHGKKLFSKSYMRILKNYFSNAVAHGINTVFLPLFSHPQKDVEGSTPPVTQLVDASLENGEYTFDFSRLESFIRMAKKCGFSYFETSHVASQQGARHCPKIVGKIDGRDGVLFDCHTPCSDPNYIAFLRKLFRELETLFEKLGIMEKCYFHISDEPLVSTLDNYRTIGEAVRQILPKAKLIDAVNDVRFAEMKILDYPVVGTNHADEFLDKQIPIWLYYCCDQSSDYLSNRFFNFPSLRTRVIGVQLYLTAAKGFLHWAYNYWLDVLTRKYVNPRFQSDGGGVYPAGDCFIVYPGEEGPYSSLREKAFAAGIRDYRALKTLEGIRGRAFVLSLLKKYGFQGLRQYPKDENVFTVFWNEIQKLLEEDKRERQ